MAETYIGYPPPHIDAWICSKWTAPDKGEYLLIECDYGEASYRYLMKKRPETDLWENAYVDLATGEMHGAWESGWNDGVGGFYGRTTLEKKDGSWWLTLPEDLGGQRLQFRIDDTTETELDNGMFIDQDILTALHSSGSEYGSGVVSMPREGGRCVFTGQPPFPESELPEDTRFYSFKALLDAEYVLYRVLSFHELRPGSSYSGFMSNHLMKRGDGGIMEFVGGTMNVDTGDFEESGAGLYVDNFVAVYLQNGDRIAEWNGYGDAGLPKFKFSDVTGYEIGFDLVPYGSWDELPDDLKDEFSSGGGSPL